MLERGRLELTRAERAELWSRWKAGETLSDIGRALGKGAGSVFRLVRRHGGIEPPQRKRSPLALTCAEREEISRGIAAGVSMRELARALGRSASTVSREIARNGGLTAYRAEPAEARAERMARRPKPCKLAKNGRLRRLVAVKLKDDWSPEQIAGWLRQTYPESETLQVSHEAIYRSLFVQSRGALKQELLKHLRTRRLMRHSVHATRADQGRGQIVDAISIRERPAAVEDRAIPGHWEGDLLCGSNNTHVATLVERRSRYTMLVKVDGKDATTVANALKRKILRLPAELRRSLTWDRGCELAKHRDITLATDIAIYFCDPHSPWQRGTNENTNGLLRQYFPKGTDLSVHSQAHLNKVARLLNGRPRKTLGFRTPADKLRESVAMTG